MDMNLADCFYANETLAGKSAHPDIRLKRAPEGAWSRSDADNATLAAFSGVCYFTALHLKALPALRDVPIGLVQSSVGGTVIESWMSSDALLAAGYPAANATCGATVCSGQRNCGNFAPLIAPLAPLVVQLCLW